ncbi:MAG: hypothetical protein B6D61_06995 [Bacteroidetes bacterium 4484_249]|nr:MAG: hypothetical protein B6D61_06995 [Bacteroidetes bacterium 4484_249]
MEAYIRGIGNISPQRTFENSSFLENIREPVLPYMTCIEPNYREFMESMQLRRMGRILKMGVTASRICLEDAGVQQPDAIITGTGLGLLQDTEKFLTTMLDNEEKFLNPTAFIQSTHNTVGAHIAVMLKCNKYNYTYVHNNISFESAMLDSLMQLEENPELNILLGGLDEMTKQYFQITEKAGFWKKSKNELTDGNQNNIIIPGEGASFFVLSKKQKKSNYAKIKGVKTFYKPLDTADIFIKINEFLESSNLSAADVDLVILGQHDRSGDSIFDNVRNNLFQKSTQTYFKHLCGEYNTSTAFATWLAAKILKHQFIPEKIVLSKNNKELPLKNILIYNHFRNKYHSLILLSDC